MSAVQEERAQRARAGPPLGVSSQPRQRGSTAEPGGLVWSTLSEGGRRCRGAERALVHLYPLFFSN